MKSLFFAFVGLCLLLVSVQALLTKEAQLAPAESLEPEAALAPEIAGEGEEESYDDPPRAEEIESLPTDTMGESRLAAPQLPTEQDLFGEKLSISISGAELGKCYKPYFEYYKPQYVSPCCPKKWNYQCRSSAYKMPCFYDSNVRGWCCPIAPQVYAQRCLCNSCAVLGTNCVEKGYCARRYTKKWFIAICWRYGFWATLKYFVKPVPTSCYCKTKSFVKPLAQATLDLTKG